MKYRIYLTEVTENNRESLSEKYVMCRCGEFPHTMWLSASDVTGKVVLHGVGYDSSADEYPPTMGLTPEEVCQSCVDDDLRYGHTVFLTPDVNEFIRLIDEYLGH